MELSSSEFVALIIIVGIVFLSVGGFYAFADQDYRLRFTDTKVSIRHQDSGQDLESLDTVFLALTFLGGLLGVDVVLGRKVR